MDMSWYRSKVAHVPKYDSATWQNKVKNMPDMQVMALYYKFKKDGLFDKRKKEVKEDSKYYQMTIFDFIKGENDGR